MTAEAQYRNGKRVSWAYLGPAENFTKELVPPGSIQVELTGVQTIPSSEVAATCFACGRPILRYYPRWCGEEPWRYYHWDCAEQIPYTGADEHLVEQTRRILAGEQRSGGVR